MKQNSKISIRGVDEKIEVTLVPEIEKQKTYLLNFLYVS